MSIIRRYKLAINLMPFDTQTPVDKNFFLYLKRKQFKKSIRKILCELNKAWILKFKYGHRKNLEITNRAKVSFKRNKNNRKELCEEKSFALTSSLYA